MRGFYRCLEEVSAQHTRAFPPSFQTKRRHKPMVIGVRTAFLKCNEKTLLRVQKVKNRQYLHWVWRGLRVKSRKVGMGQLLCRATVMDCTLIGGSRFWPMAERWSARGVNHLQRFC
jgi:hypothetical protein